MFIKKRCTLISKLDHLIAHIFAYHFLNFRKFGKVDDSHGRHLFAVRTGNVVILCLCTSRAVETVYLLVYKKNLMVPFYGWGSAVSRLKPLRGGILLFTTKLPEILGTHFIDFGRMKG